MKGNCNAFILLSKHMIFQNLTHVCLISQDCQTHFLPSTHKGHFFLFTKAVQSATGPEEAGGSRGRDPTALTQAGGVRTQLCHKPYPSPCQCLRGTAGTQQHPKSPAPASSRQWQLSRITGRAQRNLFSLPKLINHQLSSGTLHPAVSFPFLQLLLLSRLN